MNDKVTYIHGTESSEQDRLKLLNQLTNDAFLQFLEFEESSSILEVGSGLGILTRQLAERVPKGEVLGVEFFSQQLAQAESSLPNLHFVQGDAHQLQFEPNRFDVVYCRYLLEHVADPVQVLREMHRVLKPSGKVFLQENNILVISLYPECPHFDQVWKKFALLQDKLGGDALIGKKLFSFLKQADFREIQLSYAPEIHYSGKPTFQSWIENLVGNIRSGEKELEANHVATREEIEQAIAELRELLKRNDASMYFYWNRASGVKRK